MKYDLNIFRFFLSLFLLPLLIFKAIFERFRPTHASLLRFFPNSWCFELLHAGKIKNLSHEFMNLKFFEIVQSKTSTRAGVNYKNVFLAKKKVFMKYDLNIFRFFFVVIFVAIVDFQSHF